MNHIKPTIEELDRQTQEAIEEAEKLKDLPPEPEEDQENLEPTTPQDEEETEPEKQEEAPEEAEPSPEEKERLQQELEEKEKKLSASAREAQKLYAKNRVLNQALLDADEIPEPTEDELKKEFGEDTWELMSDVEKYSVKEAIVSKRWREKISDAKKQGMKIEKWNQAVDEFVEDPKNLIDHPELEGKTDSFKAFAAQEDNNNVPFKILVSSFLYEESKKKTTHKGSMFLTGSGGPNDKPTPKSNKMGTDEARQLRLTNYTLWKEKLSAGMIEDDF